MYTPPTVGFTDLRLNGQNKLLTPGSAHARKKAPQSNFISTVILNFDHVYYFDIFCHFI